MPYTTARMGKGAKRHVLLEDQWLCDRTIDGDGKHFQGHVIYQACEIHEGDAASAVTCQQCQRRLPLGGRAL